MTMRFWRIFNVVGELLAWLVALVALVSAAWVGARGVWLGAVPLALSSAYVAWTATDFRSRRRLADQIVGRGGGGR